jgi:hypothetical protein
MRQGNNRRGRQPKQQKQGTIPTRNQVFDSNGPDVRVRGNAHQVYDKYSALAREATAAGNHIQAEAYHQFAEHYLRLHLAATVMGSGNNNRRGGGNPKDQFPPEALEDPLIFRPDMPEPQERNEQNNREEGEGGEGGGERRERRDRNRDRGERGDRDDRRQRRDRKPRNQGNASSNGGDGAQVDPSEQDQPDIPLFHAGMEAPEGEAIVESRAPKPVPAPPPMDEGDGSES